MVPQRLCVVTIGVRDMRGMVNFYKSLGWQTAIEIKDDITVFKLQGALLSLYPLDKLAADGKVSPAEPTAGIRNTFAITVDEAEQVTEVVNIARKAGGRITKPTKQEAWGGYSAYFADPENNYWEVVWLPAGSNMASLIQEASQL